eukprot:TRINITY_DN15668_c0_g1_i1.p1 TRINITY_DN15668_c0_g1~~TRINITY_DN15668_c0_g1_i1.p1  ORF type:complete len:365 (+),score=68.27 TRINITY_DN15668_c0_g1_i1:533-1627(+)
MMVQSMSSIWKVLKMRLTSAGVSSDTENEIVNTVGNQGDLFAELVEFFTLLPFFSFDMSLRSMLVVSALTLATSNVLLVVATLLYFRRFPLDPAIERETAVANANQRLKSGGGRRRLHAAVNAVSSFVGTRVRYIWGTPAVLHSLTSSLAVLLLYAIIANPLTVQLTVTHNAAEAVEAGVDVEAASGATRANLCAGLITALLRQGWVLNASFCGGSSLYLVTLVRCPARHFFSTVMPALALVCALGLGIAELAPGTGLAMLMPLSVGQVLPYYLSQYDFFVLSTATGPTYYGSVTTLYSLLSQGIYMVGALLASWETPLSLLMPACAFLLIALVVHGWYAQPLYRDPHWAAGDSDYVDATSGSL